MIWNILVNNERRCFSNIVAKLFFMVNIIILITIVTTSDLFYVITV